MATEEVIDLEQQADGTFIPSGKTKNKKSTFKKRKVPNMGSRPKNKSNSLLSSFNTLLDGIEDGLEVGERVVDMVDKFKKSYRR